MYTIAAIITVNASFIAVVCSLSLTMLVIVSKATKISARLAVNVAAVIAYMCIRVLMCYTLGAAAGPKLVKKVVSMSVIDTVLTGPSSSCVGSMPCLLHSSKNAL
jgi:hypothetical protein